MHHPAVAWLLLIFLLAPSLASAAAQEPDVFLGRLVLVGSDNPIPRATVTIAGVPGSTVTDADGTFEWRPAPAPPVQFVVTLPDGRLGSAVYHGPLLRSLATIAVTSLASESVTILGAAPGIRTTPAAGATMLSRGQVSLAQPQHLTQVLETVPGVSQVSEGHAAVPAIRGLARGRTLLLVDGVRVTAERRAGPSATFLDPATIDVVDIARGSGSVAYGSDAMGGVIAVHTRRPEPGAPLRVRMSATAGAGVPAGHGNVELSKGFARGGILVNAHARSAGDYRAPNGGVFNSGWRDGGVLIRVTHAAWGGTFSAGLQSDTTRQAGRPRNNSTTARFSYPFENSHRFTGSFDRRNISGFDRVSVTAFIGNSHVRTDQARPGAVDGEPLLERADVRARDFQITATAARHAGRAAIDLGIDVHGRFGLEADDVVEYREGDAIQRTTSASIEQARRTDAGTYVQLSAPWTRHLLLSGGARVDRVRASNRGGFFGDRETGQAAWSAFGALTTTPHHGLSLTVQLARAFRDPTLSDRYFRGPSGRGFVTGNPNLGAETSLQTDVAFRYTTARVRSALYLYRYRIADLVERFESAPDSFEFRNRGQARLRGIEAEVQADLGLSIMVEIGAQLARGLAVDGAADAALDDVPPATLFVAAQRQFPRGYGHLRLTHRARDSRPGPTEIGTPAATLVDAGAGWRLTPRFELRGQVRNLFDMTYAASPDPRGVPAPGVSASLTAVVELTSP